MPPPRAARRATGPKFADVPPEGAYSKQMTNSPGKRKHLSSSPFQPDPEPTIESFAVDDLVSHDLYGMGRVVSAEAHAVTVNFGAQTVRIKSPYNKLHQL